MITAAPDHAGWRPAPEGDELACSSQPLQRQSDGQQGDCCCQKQPAGGAQEPGCDYLPAVPDVKCAPAGQFGFVL